MTTVSPPRCRRPRGKTCMRKALVTFGCLACALFAAGPREIVRKAVEQDERNSQVLDNYTFLQRQEIRELDHSGQMRSERAETYEVIPLEGSAYKRLVARNDRPLSPVEQRIEDQKLQQNTEERLHETSGQRERRVAEWRHRQDRQRQPLLELPDAFDFKLVTEEDWNGRPTYVIDAVPKPGYKPKSQFTSFFPKVKIRAWIDKADFQGSRIEIEAMDTIAFGGFLLRLEKGSKILIEQARMDDDLWLPRHVSITAAARILLLKSLNREMDYSFSDYQKFEANSRVVFLRPPER